METAGSIIALIGLSGIVGLCIQAFFLLWGARLCGILPRTFGKALGTTILSGVASFIMSLIFAMMPVAALICGFLLSALIMKAIFSTTFGKAFCATVLAWILGIVVIGGLAFFFAGAAGVALFQ
jgi:hypothetical protein